MTSRSMWCVKTSKEQERHRWMYLFRFEIPMCLLCFPKTELDCDFRVPFTLRILSSIKALYADASSFPYICHCRHWGILKTLVSLII
jgi:hypothetical protein